MNNQKIAQELVAVARELVSEDWTAKLISVVESTYSVASQLENTPGLNARKAEKIISMNFDLDDWGKVDWNKVARHF